MLFHCKTLVSLASFIISNPIYRESTHNTHSLQIQEQDATVLFIAENESQNYVPGTSKDRLIKTAEDKDAVAMSESEIFTLYQVKQRFIDVTEGDFDLIEELASSRHVSASFPTDVSHEEQTRELIEKIDTKRMEAWLTSLTKFHTRYYKSKTGKDSASWIFSEIQALSKQTADGIELTVERFEHSWGQFSIIAKYHATAPASKTSEAEIVILSAHQDSVNQWNPWFGRSPGADDNGSGSTTIFETLSILVEAGYIPEKRNLEFHWYSAEEGGLLGSQKIVASYLQKKRPIFAVLHSDMTGYQPDGLDPIVGIATDFVSKPLYDSLIKVSEAYSDVEWKFTKCGYGCSDHVSWTKGNVPSAFIFEALFENSSPFIHSTDDTVKHISFKHMSSFVRVVLGFLVEVGQV